MKSYVLFCVCLSNIPMNLMIWSLARHSNIWSLTLRLPLSLVWNGICGIALTGFAGSMSSKGNTSSRIGWSILGSLCGSTAGMMGTERGSAIWTVAGATTGTGVESITVGSGADCAVCLSAMCWLWLASTCLRCHSRLDFSLHRWSRRKSEVFIPIFTLCSIRYSRMSWTTIHRSLIANWGYNWKYKS